MSEAVLLRDGEVHLSPLVHRIEVGAQRLGISRRKFDELVKDGSVRTVRIGSRVLVPESELQRFIEQAIEDAA